MWVVDTCVVLDVFEHDPRFGLRSAELLQSLLPDGLVICPVTMIELAAAFGGDWAAQTDFLQQASIGFSETWSVSDTESSHQAWNAYVSARRKLKVAKRPLADLLIGGFAANRSGLVTRNPSDFRRWFPDLLIREP
jgi:predicted nucleic acid-binding protein